MLHKNKMFVCIVLFLAILSFFNLFYSSFFQPFLKPASSLPVVTTYASDWAQIQHYRLKTGEVLVTNPSDFTVLVNKHQHLFPSYKPADLTIPRVIFSFSENLDKKKLREKAAHALEDLFADAMKSNIHLVAVSGFRSYETQKALFSYNVDHWGKAKASSLSAKAGQSEHQTGLAMDISAASVDLLLTEKFAETAEGVWLAQNAHRFGYIIRFPKGKETLTGYRYEPWHIRYVGNPHASIIYQNALTLEEYVATYLK